MSDDQILREVDEELRRDRLNALWKRFGPWVIIAAVGVVLAVAVNEGWQWWQQSNAARSSDILYEASEQSAGGDNSAALETLAELESQGAGGYPTLARFNSAALLATEGQFDEAIAAYDALAASESNRHLRATALLLAANLLADKGDVSGVETRIADMIAPNDPFRNMARETIGLARYQAGDLDGARAMFDQILNDPEAGFDQRNRVQVFIDQLTAMGVTDPAAAAEADAEAQTESGTDTAEPPADNSSEDPSAQ